MFICEECLTRYANQALSFSSFGVCELCGEVRRCADIPSRYLQKKHVFVAGGSSLCAECGHGLLHPIHLQGALSADQIAETMREFSPSAATPVPHETEHADEVVRHETNESPKE